MAKKPDHITTVTEAFKHLGTTGQTRTINSLLKHEAAAATIQAHASALMKVAEIVYDKGQSDFCSKARTGTQLIVRNTAKKDHTLMGMATSVRRLQDITERMFVWVDYYSDEQDVAGKLVALDRHYGKTNHPEQDPAAFLTAFLEGRMMSYYTELMASHLYGMFQSYLDSGYKCVVAIELNGNAVFSFTNPKGYYKLVDMVYNHDVLLVDLAHMLCLIEA